MRQNTRSPNSAANPEAGEAAAQLRARDKDGTRKRLSAAIINLTNAGVRLSIKGVAEAAGVHPSLVHHVYPDIAEEIRARAGSLKVASAGEAENNAAERLKQLRNEIARLEKDLAKLASVNLTLQMRVNELEAGAGSKTVVSMSGDRSRRMGAAPVWSEG